MKNYTYFVCVLLVYTDANFMEDKDYWGTLGIADIKEALSIKPNTGVAKNVILFVGDGMGLTTLTASRIYEKTEKGYLAFEKFPNIGVLKTYSADRIVPDSCSTATALFCGVKVNAKTGGVDATVPVDDCKASLNKKTHLKSIIDWAQDVGKATGFVTTTRVTHATPLALYAHVPDREWECEAKMPLSASKCKDVARQLIEDLPGKNINVIMGGGRQCLVSNVNGSTDNPVDTWACYSKDGRNLIKEWESDKASRNMSHAFVSNNQQLNELDLDVEYVLGIFANGHLKYNHEQDIGPKGTPSLSNMTEKAIQVLKRNKNGFILMVEGGLIDFAHHRGQARKALSETIEFSNAVEKALAMTQDVVAETLIVVTSDHGHSLVLGGEPNRTNNILDVAQKSKIDGMGYTTLLYGTGAKENYQFVCLNNSLVRRDPMQDDTTSFDYHQQAAVLTHEVMHSGTDVLVYATGPMSHLFSSVHEQTYVAYVIAFAAKIGDFKENSCIKATVQPVLIIFLLFLFCLN